MLYRFFGLGHYAIVRSDNQNHDIGDLGTAGAHGSKGCVARRIDKGDFAIGRIDAIGTDMLGDAAGFA